MLGMCIRMELKWSNFKIWMGDCCETIWGN